MTVRSSPIARSGIPRQADGRTGVPKSIVPMLLRTRPVASAPWLRLHAISIGGSSSASGVPTPDADGSGPREQGFRRGFLVVNVPKRICRRAVERNAIRRVAREAWRASGLHDEPVDLLVRVHASPWPSDQAGSGRSGTMAGGAVLAGKVSSRDDPDRFAGNPAERVAMTRPAKRSLRALKRRARPELDSLFARARTGLLKRRMLR